jgi:selenocysteine lyase/cysteine desulfurase
MHHLEHYRRTEFAASIARSVYLNHAASSPSPARVQKAVCDAITLVGSDPEAFFMESFLPAWNASRQGLADLMGVDPQWVAISRNTGHALAIAADGMALEPGDNVIIADCEYPAVIFPWYAQAWRGIETRVLPAGPHGLVTAEAIEPLIDSRTRAIAVSWVQFGTGYRTDLRAIADLAHAHGALIIVDVIQGLGALQLDPTLPLDVIATGAHKWLMAPHGCGALYIAPEHLEKFHPTNIGALSVTDPFKFDPMSYTLKPNTQRYEEGTPNALGLIGMAAALSLIQEAGIAEIEKQVLDLAGYATERLLARGCAVDSPQDREHQSGLVLFRHPTLDNDAALQKLRDAGVRASIRGGRVRLSPHFYNTTEDLDTAIAAL